MLTRVDPVDRLRSPVIARAPHLARYCSPDGRDGIQCCGYSDEIIINGFRLPSAPTEEDGGA